MISFLNKREDREEGGIISALVKISKEFGHKRDSLKRQIERGDTNKKLKPK